MKYQLQVLLSDRYQWDSNPPTTEAEIIALVAATPVPLPAAYLACLRLSDGGEGFFSGYPRYVRLWSAQTAISSNRDYEIQKYLPGFIGFGDDGGSDLVGFDTRWGEPYPVCAIPFASMTWEDALGYVPSFFTFVETLRSR